MASFASFFYELFFGSNWSKSYCEDPTKTVTATNVATANIATAVLPLAATTIEPATADTNTVDLAPTVLPLISPSTFKRRRLGGYN